jgi:hypothetical protein
MSETKQKLTLTVDADTVEAAKKLGLNISEVTESVLRGYTYDPDRAEEGATRTQYQELLATMDPLLEKYGASVIVGDCQLYDYGEDNDGDPVFYSGHGHLYAEEEVGSSDSESQITVRSIKAEEVRFDRPSTILKRFLFAIEQAKSARLEEVEGLLLAKRLIEALNEQERMRTAARRHASTVQEAEGESTDQPVSVEPRAARGRRHR